MASFGIFLAEDASGSGRREAPAEFPYVVQLLPIDDHHLLRHGNHGRSNSIVSILSITIIAFMVHGGCLESECER